jgi:hypothetical protein
MWTSPDPAGQFANPYGYGGDPVNFVDPNGEWAFFDSFIVSFTVELFRSGFDFGSAWDKGVNSGWNDIKLWGGRFQGDFGDFLSRNTWEKSQNDLGFFINQTLNMFGLVEDVDYYRDATLVETTFSGWGAFTLGTFITAQGGTEVGDPLFQHEYGHTYQSSILGPFYFMVIAVPSLISASINDYDGHNKFYTESWANYYSRKHFKKLSMVDLSKEAQATEMEVFQYGIKNQREKPNTKAEKQNLASEEDLPEYQKEEFQWFAPVY